MEYVTLMGVLDGIPNSLETNSRYTRVSKDLRIRISSTVRNRARTAHPGDARLRSQRLSQAAGMRLKRSLVKKSRIQAVSGDLIVVFGT